MKNLIRLAICVFLFQSICYGQTPIIQQSFDISNARGLTTTPINIAGRGLGAHILTWSLQSGVMTSCTISFQTSPTNTATSTWTEQSTGDCTSSGQTSYLVFTTNFFRIKATTFITQSGTGLVTVNYNGYVIPPTSISAITTAPLNTQAINNTYYASNYSGANWGVKTNLCLVAAAATTGICDTTGLTGSQVSTINIYSGITVPPPLILGTVALAASGTSWIIPSNAIITGSGASSVITYSGSGYLIDTLSGTDIPNNLYLRDFNVTTTAASNGFLRLGRTSQNYSNANFRSNIHFDNLFITGPGATSVGTVGLSLTQCITCQFDNITIKNYETPLIWDRGGNSLWNKPRFWSYAVGPTFSIQAGSGSAAVGCDMSIINGGEFLGPITGSNYALNIDACGIEVNHTLLEVQVGSSAAGFIHITANGNRFRDIGSFFSLAGGATNPTNLMVWDAGYTDIGFIGTILTVNTFNAISAGAPSAGNAGNRAFCIYCSSNLWTAFYTVGTTKAIASGQGNGNFYSISADERVFYGPGGVVLEEFNSSKDAITGAVVSVQDSTSNTGVFLAKQKRDSVNGDYVSYDFVTTDDTKISRIKSIRNATNSTYDVTFQVLPFGGSLTDAFTIQGFSSPRIVLPSGTPIQLGSIPQASLPVLSNAFTYYCSDCKGPSDGAYAAGSACANAGSGALAVRINGTWRCY